MARESIELRVAKALSTEASCQGQLPWDWVPTAAECDEYWRVVVGPQMREHNLKRARRMRRVLEKLGLEVVPQ